jgi:transposase
MTIKDVSEEIRIGWETAKNIDKENAKKYVVGLSEISPCRIGIDEIACEKGHKYLTVVRDVDLEKVIWVGKNRQKETLDKFFNELGEVKSHQISLVAMDMWDPFIASAKEHTNAEIVFDKFHIAKHVNEAVDDVRKSEFAKADKEERVLMKHKRFLILSRKKNLDRQKKESLKDLMKKNDTLYKAYLLKEQILDIMDEPAEKKAVKRFAKWFDNIASAKIPQFDKTAKMLERHSYGILNYFKHKVTNAASEGFNTKINVIKRRAYGFRDLEYFMYKIIQLCGVSSQNP